jgi:hypothetical protein
LKIHFNINLHLCLGLISGLFHWGFPTKTLYAPLLSRIHATCPAHIILLDLITWIIFGKEYKSQRSSLCSPLHSHYLIPLRPKYLPQHLTLKHPQPMLLPWCYRQGFTPIPHRQKLYFCTF